MAIFVIYRKKTLAEDLSFPHNTPISYDAIFLIDFSGWDIGRMLLMEEVSDAESLFNSFRWKHGSYIIPQKTEGRSISW